MVIATKNGHSVIHFIKYLLTYQCNIHSQYWVSKLKQAIIML